MSTVTLIQADARKIPLADKSVQCVITSPPYYGLRDYGTARWEGGDEGCDHDQRRRENDATSKESDYGGQARDSLAGRDTCRKCGARRVDAQIGLEPTIEDYVARLVAVFREVKRILRDDGTCWVNLGDSYSCSPKGNPGDGINGNRFGESEHSYDKRNTGIAPKNLLGIPWRVAFALQADGWILRSEIIWAKPNPMPESVTDRPTKAHEQVFLMAKRERYFYDAEAVREKLSGVSLAQIEQYERDGVRDGIRAKAIVPGQAMHTGSLCGVGGGSRGAAMSRSGRNLRSVWTITPKPLAHAHFATFPCELVERCVKAGTSERGQCPTCGKAWERVVETWKGGKSWHDHENDIGRGNRQNASGESVVRINGSPYQAGYHAPKTLGWRPGCECPPREPVPQVVFDCFGGAGTVPMVASNLGRRGVMTELNPAYIEIARRRITRPHAKPERVAKEEHHPLFAGIEP